MSEFLKMAKKGKIYLFGSGDQKVNPIHGADLAEVCVAASKRNEKEIEVGGPETFTHNEIVELASSALGKKSKVVHISDFLRRMTLKLGKLFMSSKDFGPVEFFMNVMANDMVAPEYGTHRLKDFFWKVKTRYRRQIKWDIMIKVYSVPGMITQIVTTAAYKGSLSANGIKKY
jgi:uncharacterized protein YbjT (DUF2867 family)